MSTSSNQNGSSYIHHEDTILVPSNEIEQYKNRILALEKMVMAEKNGRQQVQKELASLKQLVETYMVKK